MLSSKRGSNRSNRSAGGLFVALLAAALVVHTALGASAPAVAPLSDAEKIDALIRAVEARKDLQFIRMDVVHSAGEAAGVLRIKLAFAGSRVKTVDDFIDHVATASSTTGKPYFVRYPDGRQVTSAEFLRGELKRIESASAVGDEPR
ncbi:MAG: hypothetical protein E6H78_09580 [Betaproteobacteria bacterium]|nr:MAG: hypothetical protein E6H78_09580 [Betaproteobacteria bacterium]